MKSRYVCSFNDRGNVTADSLGTKGAAFAEMAQAGIPVPAGFTVTCESCTRYYDDNKIIADEIIDEIKENISRTEILTGKTFGGTDNPLLLSIRSNSRQSIPGLMDTILHLGMNDTVAEALSIRMSDPKTAYEYYLNFITVYSAMVKRFGKKQFASISEDYKSASGKLRDEDLSLNDIKELISLYKDSYKNGLGESFPEDPFDQLINAVAAGFHYWDSPRANYYRMVKEIPYSWGTAVTVQTMVYGSFLGDRSGTGVAFTRNPSNGKKERLGEFLLDSRTGDVLSGNRTPKKLDSLAAVMPDVYEEFERDCFLFENKYRDIFEISFTIEDGNFFIIKTRKAKRTGLAAFTCACDFADEGICSEKEAIKVLDPANITTLRPGSSFEPLPSEPEDEPDYVMPDSQAADDENNETDNQTYDESVGGIYNFSLFDYELDDIMTEIYSGFNVYDDDTDDTPVTDELKRIVTARIPSLVADESVSQTEPEYENYVEDDELPEIDTDVDTGILENARNVNTNSIFNDAFKSALAMEAELHGFTASELVYLENEELEEIDPSDLERADDLIYDAPSDFSEEPKEDEFEGLSEDYNELPDDPFEPLPEPPVTTIHTEDYTGISAPEDDIEIETIVAGHRRSTSIDIVDKGDEPEDADGFDPEETISIKDNEEDSIESFLYTESEWTEDETEGDFDYSEESPENVSPEDEIETLESVAWEPEEYEEPEQPEEPNIEVWETASPVDSDDETWVDPEPESEPEPVIEREQEIKIEPEPEVESEPEPFIEPDIPVSADELFSMIEKAAKPRKIKVIPIKRR
ncbi:MAG: hypothetical protein LBM41_06515 [Ruminococcus sp.]|nr:hypothetical protein [Ruminococcus sp.]